MKGGYKFISLKGKNLVVDGDAVKIDGIYESLTVNHGKATLLCDCVIDGIGRAERFVYFSVDDNNNFVGVLGINPDVWTLHITITPDDMVTLNNR